MKPFDHTISAYCQLGAALLVGYGLMCDRVSFINSSLFVLHCYRARHRLCNVRHPLDYASIVAIHRHHKLELINYQILV